MADINEVNGVFGGVDFGTNGQEGTTTNLGNVQGGYQGQGYGIGGQIAGEGEGQGYGTEGTTVFGSQGYEAGNYQGGYIGQEIGNTGTEEIGTTGTEQAGTNLPVKTGFWTSFKSFLHNPIEIELTPYQQKVEQEINDFLFQEITWEKVHDFLFQEVKFGKKRNI